MDTFSLYDDLPLFAGDLLVGWSPLADELPAKAQDELQQTETLYRNNWISNDIVKDIQISTPKPDGGISTFDGKMFGATKVNLLDLLQSEEPTSPKVQQQTQLPGLDLSTIKAEDLLSTVSEMLISDIGSNEMLVENIRNAIQCHGNNDSSDMSNDISADSGIFSGAEVETFFNSSNVGGVETIWSNGSNGLVADILSPVSSEDVDFILSSGPTSPYSTDTGSPVDSTIYGSDAMSPYSMDTSFEVNDFDNAPSAIETSDNYDDSTTTITISMKYLKEELLKPIPPPILIMEESPKRSAVRQKSQRQRASQRPYSPPPVRRQYNKISTPSVSPSPIEKKPGDSRKQRKKQQNKDAALRYRHKKREEKVTHVDECTELEKKNGELHEKVDSMTREIQYLKDLLAEVYQAKSASNSKLCK